MQDPTPLAAAAHAAGLTLPELALAVGASPVTVDWWAYRYVPIPEGRWPSLAAALGVTAKEVAAMSRVCVPIAARRVAAENGLSVAELARRTGVQSRELHACLAGRRRVTPSVAAALESALGMPAEYLTALDGGDQ